MSNEKLPTKINSQTTPSAKSVFAFYGFPQETQAEKIASLKNSIASSIFVHKTNPERFKTVNSLGKQTKMKDIDFISN